MSRDDATAQWRALAWRCYEQLPRAADRPLRLATSALLPWTNRHVALTLLRGRGVSGDEATMLYAGTPGANRYLERRFFTDESVRTALGTVSSHRLGGELRRRRASADLVVARLDRATAAFALDPAWVRVPEWVGALAPVPPDAAAFCRTSKSLAHNLARMLRAGFRGVVSHAVEDFEQFYQRVYGPFLRRRHGEEVVLSNPARLRRCFRQGGLMWVLRGDERVAGILFRVRGRTLDFVVLGTMDGALAPVDEGVILALDVFLTDHARTLGCTVIDFGGSRPSPTDGLLVYKARWDARVVANRTTFYDLGLWWERWTPALRAFLHRTPLLMRDGKGLAALWHGATSADLKGARLVLRSLERVYVVDGAGDASPPEGAPPIIRVDSAATPPWRPTSVTPPAP